MREIWTNFNSFQLTSPILHLESLHPASVLANELSAKVSSHQIVFREFFWIVFLIASSSLFLSHLNTMSVCSMKIGQGFLTTQRNLPQITSLEKNISNLIRFFKKSPLHGNDLYWIKCSWEKSIQSHVFCKKITLPLEPTTFIFTG